MAADKNGSKMRQNYIILSDTERFMLKIYFPASQDLTVFPKPDSFRP
ncbi:MAG: hypothetical protein ACON4F_02875 [Candidatus Puniceispirillaceae bacterium]